MHLEYMKNYFEHGFNIKLMHTSHIPIKKLKNPSFAALSSLKAIVWKRKI